MFQRHCVIAQLMGEQINRLDSELNCQPTHFRLDWFLFIDSDMGVVNPNHLIEEYIGRMLEL